MNILLVALGSRGDVEPFLALGNLIKQHKTVRIACIFPEQFRQLAEEEGFEFYSLGTKFLEIIEAPGGKNIMGGDLGRFEKIKLYYKLYKESKEIHNEHMQLMDQHFEAFGPDRVLYHVKSMYPIPYSAKNDIKSIFVSPVPNIVHPTDNMPTLGFTRNLGKFLNRLTYKLTNFAVLKNIKDFSRRVARFEKISSNELKEKLFSNTTLFTISEHIYPRPTTWPSHVKLVGYLERDKQTEWSPSKDLLSFMENHQKIVLVTFGSMSNPDPLGKTKLFLKLLEELGIPAIINMAEGGLTCPPNYHHKDIHFVSRIPYDWLFPKLYGVIHHGGSGTTHMTAKYGCASLIIPHIIDQFLWDKLANQCGLGPRGIAISKLKESQLKARIFDFYTNKSYKQQADKVSKQMATENHEQLILSTIFDND